MNLLLPQWDVPACSRNLNLLTHLIAVTSAVYFRTLRFLLVTLSRSHPYRNSVGTSGEGRSITLPYFQQSHQTMFITFSPFEAMVAKCRVKLLSLSNYIISNWTRNVKFFSASHLPLSTQSNAEYCDSNSVIGKGIEPHPTHWSSMLLRISRPF